MSVIEQAVIIAGGQGTRLASAAPRVPKALVPVAGRPVIDHQLDLLARHGVREVWLMLGHQSEAIMEHVGNGSRWGLACHIAREPVPLGTAGNLPAIARQLGPHFLLLYGDLVVSMDIQRLATFHIQRQAAATLVVHPNDHPYDSDLVDIDACQRVRALLPAKTRPEGWYRNLVNAAVYVFAHEVMELIAPGVPQDVVRDVLPRMLARGRPIYGYETCEYLKDMGTPERLAAVNRDWQRGRIRAELPRAPRPAVFLDRDGVLNREIGELTRADELELLPGAAQAIRAINRAGLLAIVVTNQPMIAKGTLTRAELDRIHAKLETLLGREGAYLDAILYCPHHPERGWPGEIAALKIPCACRKPAPGLIHEAATRLPIDLARSCLIGDSWRDVLAGRAARIPTYGVETGIGFHGPEGLVEPDFRFSDLAQVAQHIVRGHGISSLS